MKSALGPAAILAALAISSPAFAGPDEDALAKIEHDFAAMQITKDPATIARVAAVMDEGFRFTDPTTRSPGSSKAQILALIRSDQFHVEAMDFRPFTIRIFGSTALVEGVNTGRASVAGQDASGTYAWVDVFEKRRGKWIWLFSQSGTIGEALSDKDPCSRPPCPDVQPGFSVGK